jgi:tetratricopeptide (TPR) repeat protein
VHPRLYVARAELRIAVTGDLDGAIADCEKAIAISPHFFEAYFQRAIAFAAKGNYSAAHQDIDAMVAKNPTEPYAYRRRAEFKYMMGDFADAAADYARAISFSKSDPNYAHLFRWGCIASRQNRSA